VRVVSHGSPQSPLVLEHDDPPGCSQPGNANRGCYYSATRHRYRLKRSSQRTATCSWRVRGRGPFRDLHPEVHLRLRQQSIRLPAAPDVSRMRAANSRCTPGSYLCRSSDPSKPLLQSDSGLELSTIPSFHPPSWRIGAGWLRSTRRRVSSILDEVAGPALRAMAESLLDFSVSCCAAHGLLPYQRSYCMQVRGLS
jgi:hypothetical protein